MNKKVLFVCLGNICRSPAAEGVFKHKIQQSDLASTVSCDSAGILSYHTGENADPRMIAQAKSRGIVLDSIARQIKHSDFDDFDLIITMDEKNFSDVNALITDLESDRKAEELESLRKKIKKMADFHSNAAVTLIPDPYFGGIEGFDEVLDLLDPCCENLMAYVRENI